jgi:molecular chaperone GrpE
MSRSELRPATSGYSDGSTVKTDSNTHEQPAAPVDESAESQRAAEKGSAEAASGDNGDATPEGPEVELARTRERLLRMAADFDNYRKRVRRDISDAERRVQEELLRGLLPTFDNLERAAGHAETAPDVKALAEGLKMVLRQFQDTLSSLGIERVESVGKPFDPTEHEAVQHVESNDVPPGAVVQELQGGYRWQGRLMRPALVVVSKAAPNAPPGN